MPGNYAPYGGGASRADGGGSSFNIVGAIYSLGKSIFCGIFGFHKNKKPEVILEAASVLQRGKYPTICQHRDWHNLKVSEQVATLRAAGFCVAENVRIARLPSPPSSYAVADYIARAPGSTPLQSIYYLREVKTGDADLPSDQRINYYSGLTQIRSGNAESIGLQKPKLYLSSGTA